MMLWKDICHWPIVKEDQISETQAYQQFYYQNQSAVNRLPV